MRNFILTLLICLFTIESHAAFSLTWGSPSTQLDSPPSIGDSDLNATVDIDPYGNAVAVWSRTTDTGAGEDIWVSTYNHSTRVWKVPAKISGGGTAENPAVSMDAAGNATIMWEEGFPTQIMSRTLSAKGVWTPPLSQGPDFIHPSKNAQIAPQIAVDRAGEVLAIWMEYYKGMYHIHSSQRPFGQPWNYMGAISSGLHSAHLHFTTSLAINESGSAVAVWHESNDSTGLAEVHGAQYINCAWGSPLLIASKADCQCLFPTVGIDAVGDSVIAWNQFGAQNIIASKKLINGVLSEELVVSKPQYIAQRPSLGVDSLGNAVVVYERYAMDGFGSMHKFVAGASLSYNGSSWTEPVDISGPSSNPDSVTGAGYPVLSLNSLGDGVVIWKEYNGNQMVIQGAGYSLGTWSLFKTLSSVSGSYSIGYDMGVGINSAGNIIAVWPEDPTGNHSQYIQATSGVGLAIASPLPPVSIPAEPDAIVSFPVVSLPPITVPITHPTIPLPSYTLINQNLLATKIDVQPGSQILHRFPCHGDLINILNWSAPSGNFDHYKIYRGNLSTLIGTTKETRFEDHQRIPKKSETYLITCVDSNGQESSPVTITVQPMK